jgi:hypothetical protein
MSFTTRLGIFIVVAGAGVVAWHWNSALDGSRDATQLAIKQFQNSDAVAADLQQASSAQNWWPLAGPALLALFAAVLFWDDLERWWKRDQVQEPA